MQKRDDGALSSCARSLLSRTLISRVICSNGPVMQARYRLEMGGVGEALSY